MGAAGKGPATHFYLSPSHKGANGTGQFFMHIWTRPHPVLGSDKEIREIKMKRRETASGLSFRTKKVAALFWMVCMKVLLECDVTHNIF